MKRIVGLIIYTRYYDCVSRVAWRSATSQHYYGDVIGIYCVCCVHVRAKVWISFYVELKEEHWSYLICGLQMPS